MSASRQRILLIDDDEDSFIITRGLLSQWSGTYDLEWQGSFESGLQTLREGRHDACLLDYRLGARDGLELLRQAITEGCRVPIIMLTGQDDHVLDLQAMKAGAADYLVKERGRNNFPMWRIGWCVIDRWNSSRQGGRDGRVFGGCGTAHEVVLPVAF